MIEPVVARTLAGQNSSWILHCVEPIKIPAKSTHWAQKGVSYNWASLVCRVILAPQLPKLSIKSNNVVFPTKPRLSNTFRNSEPIATIIVSLEQPFEASIVPNSMFEPIKRQRMELIEIQ